MGDSLYSPVAAKEGFKFTDDDDHERKPRGISPRPDKETQNFDVPLRGRRHTVRRNLDERFSTGSPLPTPRQHERSNSVASQSEGTVGLERRGSLTGEEVQQAIEKVAQGMLKGATSVTRFLAPEILQTESAKKERRLFMTNRDIKASPQLAKVVFFNALFSPLWLFFSINLHTLKFVNIDVSSETIAKILNPILWSLWAVCEVPRLVLGYYGNMREQVPYVLFFLLLTIFPQLPILVYFGLLQEVLLPFEIAGTFVMILFLMHGFIVGVYALYQILRNQARKFYLTDWTSTELTTDEVL